MRRTTLLLILLTVPCIALAQPTPTVTPMAGCAGPSDVMIVPPAGPQGIWQVPWDSPPTDEMCLIVDGTWLPPCYPFDQWTVELPPPAPTPDIDGAGMWSILTPDFVEGQQVQVEVCNYTPTVAPTGTATPTGTPTPTSTPTPTTTVPATPRIILPGPFHMTHPKALLNMAPQ